MESAPKTGSLVVMAMVAVLGCVGPGSTGPGTEAGAGRAGADSDRPKTITIGHDTAREGFAPWFIMGSGGIFQWDELHSNFLVSTDAHGALEARLAASLPSLDDGTITLLPDGRMRAVWKVRPNLKWQDGAPLTAADLLFSWHVSSHPEIPIQRSPVFNAIDVVEAPDQLTAVFTYKTTFYRALDLGFRDFYVLPRHQLAAAFEGPPEAFKQLPYWTAEYVHTGPYRVTQFDLGEQVVLSRFDEYFRGRPKIDTIIIRFIAEVLAADLPLLPLIFRISTVVGLSHLRGIEGDVAGAEGPGTYSRSAHLWERG